MSPLPGSSDYLASLLGYLKQNRPDVDARLFTAILLCLIAGERHLIIRTEEDHVPNVASAAFNILSGLFGLGTQRVVARKQDNPDDFLASLFLVPPRSPSTESPRVTPSLHRLSSTLRRDALPRKSDVRVASLDDDIDSLSSRALSPSTRSRTISNIQTSFSTQSNPAPSSDSVPLVQLPSPPPSTIRTQSRMSQLVESEPPTPIAFSQSSRILSNSRINQPQASRKPILPTALIITKLERVGFALQNALWDVLRTRRIHFASDMQSEGRGDSEDTSVYDFPSGFVTIYVCGLDDGRKPPSIEACLLDMFSFNANIVLERPPINLPPHFNRSSEPLISSSELSNLHKDAIHHTFVSASLSTYIMNLLLATRHHSHLHSSLLSARCTYDIELFIRAARILFGPSPNTSESSADQGAASCTERDVTRIFAGVVAHRLSVQSPFLGPLTSLVSTAVDVSSPKEDSLLGVPAVGLEESRATVHSILAGILHSI